MSNKVRITNRRAGNTVKLPGGIKLKRGQSIVLPSSILTHKSVRHLVTRGRLIQSSLGPSFDAVENVTDAAIHSGRDAVENAIDSALDSVSHLIDTSAAKDAVEDVLDTVEDVVESTVDSAIDAVEEAVEDVVDGVLDFLGVGSDEEDKPKEEEKPKRRRTRRKKSES